MIVASDVTLLEGRLGPAAGFYRWQRRLLTEWLLVGEIPVAVDIPTGLGKTKVMALWLIALAAGVRLPRRLVYVVDRRAVVDQATTEAENLAKALDTLLTDETIDAELRNRWKRALGFADDTGLAISTLRGQFIDNRKWMDRPQAAAIVVGTVDMIGSRLLFSGYGVSAGMRPVHAGLLGCDALIVLDEAHLVPPFAKLMRDIVDMTDADRARTKTLVPPFRLMALSATLRDNTVPTFELDADDENDPAAQLRLLAEKRLRVLDQVSTADLPDALAERAWTLAEGTRRVLIFCNSRIVAQRVKERIEERVRKHGDTPDQIVELFVGERRLRERLIALEHPDSVVRRFYPEAERDARARFLVATSAAEVGVDLDADDLVCDLVSWERMVQRFGRVNRRAHPGSARIEIIPSLSDKDAEDPIEIERLDIMRAPFVCSTWSEAADGSRDASPIAIQSLRNVPEIKTLIDQALSPEPLRPEISNALIEAWAMTSLREHPGRPIVQPWIRGWIDARPQSRIAWRSHFPLRDEPGAGRPNMTSRSQQFSDLDAYFAAAPPDPTELLEAPADRVADLIARRIDAWLARTSSIEQNAATESIRRHPIIIVLDDRYDVAAYWTADQLTSKSDRLLREIVERTVIIDAQLGGLSAEGLLDPKADAAPTTLDRDGHGDWLPPANPPQPQWRVRYGKPLDNAERLPEDWKPAGFRWTTNPDVDDADVLWVDVWRGTGATSGDAAVARFAQTLAEHHSWTEAEAGKIGELLDLPHEKTRMLRAAAFIHDSGKDRSLWQDAMNAPRNGNRPYAKTAGGAAPRLLAGYRHEFGSLSDVAKKNTSEIFSLADDDQELALHLVATHHGYSRPHINAFDPNIAPSQSAELARDSALRYNKLQRRWGAWGLAWWEALLRSADWTASRKVNDERASDE